MSFDEFLVRLSRLVRRCREPISCVVYDTAWYARLAAEASERAARGTPRGRRGGMPPDETWSIVD